jgi:hypothetical protein
MPEELRSNLPRRDYLLLPLLGILSALALLGSAEFGARRIWPAREDTACDQKTPFSGDRYKPNCTDTSKIAESPWVESAYNECGYRSNAPCGPKHPGSIRLALLGSSEAIGFLVPYPQSFAGLSERSLSRQCGRPVEVQNLAVAGIHLLQEAHRIDEALALEPDAVALLVTPGTLGQDDAPRWQPEEVKHAPSARQGYGMHASFVRLKSLLRQSTAFSVLRYYYFKDDDAYFRAQLKTEGDRTDVLRLPFSPAWRQRFDFFDSILDYLSAKTQSRQIPLVLISSISRPQAALLDLRESYPELDPFAFDRQVAQISARRGILHVTAISDFSRVRRVTSLFYVSDGHMNAAGQDILSQSFTREILQSHILERAGCSSLADSNLMVARP